MVQLFFGIIIREYQKGNPMMRLLFKSIVVVVLILGIGNYLVYLKTGQMPLRDMSERMGDDWLVDLRELFSPDQIKTDAKKVVDDIASEYADPKPAAPTTVYKWTDADGRVHFGDKPQNAGAQQVEVKIQNAISAPDQQNPAALDEEPLRAREPSPLEKARAAAEAMKARVQEQEAQ